MKKLANILNDLEISRWTAFWTLLTGGFAELAKLLCTAFTKLLRKADPAKLKKYAELAAKIAMFAQSIVDIFVAGDKEKDAATATIVCLRTLAEHLEDGQYTPDELDADVDNIIAAIDAWKKVADDEDEKEILAVANKRTLAIGNKANEKVTKKIAEKKAKIKGKFALIAFALSLGVIATGCATADPSSRSTSGTYGDTEPSVKVVFEKGSHNNTATITVPITMGDAAVASADSSGSTESMTATPTNTTDIKPKTDVNTTGGRSAGVLETLIGAFGTWLTTPSGKEAVSATAPANSTGGDCKDGTCKDGNCSPCTDGSCSDGSCSECTLRSSR